MNILCLYDNTQTYTTTVFEHITSFSESIAHKYFFSHQDQRYGLSINFSHFDAIIIHYSVRLPYNQISEKNAELLSDYKGLKVLFIQDEYDYTYRAWEWIKQLGIKLVFTVVPENNINKIYPPDKLPGIKFVSNLTGYVPEGFSQGVRVSSPSERKIVIGYRGRPLHVKYGQLGLEKVGVGSLVKEFCKSEGIQHDIEWSEETRIYRHKWYEFISSCRAMLGSESGSNVFDWDGTLTDKINKYRITNPHASDDEVYTELIQPLEMPGLMNQASPRIFEAISVRTILVLFEGDYSGVVTAGIHYIPLKKDGSNLDEVFKLLGDSNYVDTMAERAYQDIIASGKYSYNNFVHMVEKEIEQTIQGLTPATSNSRQNYPTIADLSDPTFITTSPIRAQPPLYKYKIMFRTIRYIWRLIPEATRTSLKIRLKRL